MRVVATFEISRKQRDTLRQIIEQIRPQIHLSAPILIQEFDDEQVPCQGADEAGAGQGLDAENQRPQLDDPSASADADGNGELADSPRQNSTVKPKQRLPNKREAR